MAVQVLNNAFTALPRLGCDSEARGTDHGPSFCNSHFDILTSTLVLRDPLLLGSPAAGTNPIDRHSQASIHSVSPALLTVNRTRIRTAWFLLAAFVLGGVVGPTAHRIDHAAETHAVHSADVVRNQAETAKAAASPHASPILAVASASQLDCEFCATRILVTDPPAIDAPVAPRHAAVIAHLLPSPVHATTPTTVLSRGPPTGA
jgi:hypothetical protein